jgi:hypothetical protein
MLEEYMPSLDWIKEIDNVEDLLSGDLRIIAESCGMDVLIKLWEECPSLSLYISTVPLNEARKLYARRNYNGSNAKMLALKLGVSERFVFQAVQDDRRGGNAKGQGQKELF